MTPTSLRIGNLLRERNSGEVVKVVGLSTTSIVVSGNFRGQWQAESIEINREWLERLGFENFQHSLYSEKCECSLNQSIEVRWNKRIGWHVYLCGFGKIDHIKYVHTLQNLVYAITGQELTIKQEEK